VPQRHSARGPAARNKRAKVSDHRRPAGANRATGNPPSGPAAPGGTRNEELSPLDKRIIEHLQRDGRRPFTQIAAEIGVSEAAVRARTNRLVEHGILQVVGVTDPLKIGFHLQAMIGIRCDADKLMKVSEAVAGLNEVDYVVITAGTYDLLIEVVLEDNEALLRFLVERLRRIDGVRETETFVYLRMVKQTYQWGTR
jgi:Lrp/AsnC family transcriptional regulator for asnA, asnC and gidA